MKRYLHFLIFMASFIVVANAQTYTFNDHFGQEGFNLTAQDQQGVAVNFSVYEFTMNDLTVRGESMKTISLANHFLPGDEGAPDLPGSGRYIAIPHGAKAVLNIKSVRKEVYRDVNLAPSPRIPIDAKKGELDYNKDLRIYNSNTFYPAEPIKLSEITQVRGVDAVVLGITPFQYNPVTKELIVYRDIEVEVSFEGGNGTFGDERLRSRWWDPLLEDIFINHEQLPVVDYSNRQIDGSRATGCEYLIICPDGPEFLQWADTIRQFRTEQGIITMVVPISDVGGNSPATIESYINEAYNTWDIPPAACLLLGDYGSNGATNLTSNLLNDHPDGYNPYISDNPFSDITGDLLPDVIFARITARNAAELDLMINKFLNYERNPPTSPDFYNHPITALGWQTERWFQICSEAVGGYFKNVQGKDPVRINEVYGGNPTVDPWSTAQNTSTILGVFGPDGLGYIPATPGELGAWSGGTAADINNAVNNGSFLLQHRDHGYEDGWGEPDYSTSDISGLTNTDLPFVMSINCQTGKFNRTGECFGERFHRHEANGHASGALGLVAPTEVSYSFVNDVFVWGMYDNMWPDFLPQFGATPESRGMLPAFGNAAGKYFLYASSWPYNSSVKAITYKLFHHHGDAFTALYSEVPQNLAVTHDSQLLAGMVTFSIQADEDALIGLSVNGELIGVGTGTGSSIDIPIIAQNPPAIIDVVVTKENHFRYHAKVPVIPPTGPFVIAESYTISDPSGNNNGNLDCGETVALNMTLKNLGSESAENVTATIFCEDEFITIIDGTTEAGTIPSGETAEVAGAFSVQAADNIPDGHLIQILMEASGGDTAWASTFSIKAHAPLLEYVDFTVSDENGNNNGRLDAGETADVIISVTNKGGADAYGVYGLIACDDPFVQIVADSAFFGDIAQDQTVTQSFTVSSVVITPPGHETDFSVSFTNDMGITADGDFILYVGLFPVLILDLDGNENSADKMMTAIDDWRIFAEYKQEMPEDLSQYNTIFLCLGTYDQNHVMGESEALPFVDFLNNGGNLYLEGADTWYYDQLYNATSLHPMFNISGLTDGSSDLGTLSGAAGTFTEGMTFFFGGDNNYIDRISPVSPAYSIFSNAAPVYSAAVAYDAGTYKTIGTSFEFGGITDNANYTKNDLMLAYLNFFGMDPISEIPERPAGDTMVCTNEVYSVYTIPEISGASYYIWELNPPEAGTVDGWGAEVTVNWTPGYLGNSTLRVCGMNQSGLGPVSTSLLVNHYEAPTAQISFTGTEICAGDTTYASILLTGISPWHITVIVGNNTIILNPNKPNMDAMPLSPVEDIEVRIVSLSDATTCETTGFPSDTITVIPLPSIPAKPDGPEYVDLFAGSSSVYTTSGGESSDNYTWILEPEEAGSMALTEDGMQCSIDWESSYTGEASLKVNGFSDCGEGEFSETLTISVANTFGLDENSSGVGLHLYPNPSHGKFNLELLSEKTLKAKIRLFNASGEVVWGPVEVSIDQKLIIPFNLDNHSEGMYLLQVETAKGISNRKILIN